MNLLKNIVTLLLEKDTFQENNFTNRKQRFTVKKAKLISAETNFIVEEVGSDQEKNLKLNNEYNDLNIKDDSFEDNKIDKLVNGKLLKHQTLNELTKDYTNQDDTNKVVFENENSFEEGLKSRLSLMAEKKLTEFGLTPEEKINKCNEYYMNVLYPLFTDLEEGLSLYNRKANVNINTFMISLDVRYQDKIEYKYQVTILDPDNYPILEIMKSDLSGDITIKTELTNTSIDKVSHQDIFHDFLSSYKKHIDQTINK